MTTLHLVDQSILWHWPFRELIDCHKIKSKLILQDIKKRITYLQWWSAHVCYGKRKSLRNNPIQIVVNLNTKDKWVGVNCLLSTMHSSRLQCWQCPRISISTSVYLFKKFLFTSLYVSIMVYFISHFCQSKTFWKMNSCLSS